MNQAKSADNIVVQKKRNRIEVNMATVAITKQNFEEEVLKSDKPVLLDFWAPWCGPCRMVGPVVEELSEECTGIKFAKLNVDDETEVAEQYSIMSIPTLVLFKDGVVAKRVTGARGKAELKAWLEA